MESRCCGKQAGALHGESLPMARSRYRCRRLASLSPASSQTPRYQLGYISFADQLLLLPFRIDGGVEPLGMLFPPDLLAHSEVFRIEFQSAAPPVKRGGAVADTAVGSAQSERRCPVVRRELGCPSECADRVFSPAFLKKNDVECGTQIGTIGMIREVAAD